MPMCWQMGKEPLNSSIFMIFVGPPKIYDSSMRTLHCLGQHPLSFGKFLSYCKVFFQHVVSLTCSRFPSEKVVVW